MPLYTLSVDGRAVLVFHAQDLADAEDCMADEEGWTQYIRATRSNGVPVMGANSQWSLTEATPEQRAVWETKVNDLMLDGHLDAREDAEEENYAVFLVAVDPPDSLSL